MASISEETYCPLGYWHPVLATQPLVKYVIIGKGQILGYTTFEAAAADLAAHPGTICSVENPQTSNKIVAAARTLKSNKGPLGL
jgi:hypothetical protein